MVLAWLSLGLVAVAVAVAVAGAARECKEALRWDQGSYTGGGQGWDLQLCCGVRNIWAARIDPGWKLQSPPALDSTPVSLPIPSIPFQVREDAASVLRWVT